MKQAWILISILFIFIPTSSPSSEPCTISSEETLTCSSISDLKAILHYKTKTIKSIQITQSNIPILDLNSFHPFPSLSRLSVTSSRVNRIEGSLAEGIRFFNVSQNNVSFISDSVFEGSRASVLDFSNNWLSTLPTTFFNQELRTISVIGNRILCSWVMSYNGFYTWYLNNKFALEKPDETECRLKNQVFGSISFLAAVKVKESAETHCDKIENATSSCTCNFQAIYSPLNKLPFDDYPVIHTNKHGNVSYALKVNCSNGNLTELPRISPFVLELDVSENRIENLKPLNDPSYHYQNLKELYANYNQITDLEDLFGSNFLNRFQALLLNGNNITELRESDITRIFPHSRKVKQALTLGENVINCDCFTATRLKPLLVKYETSIRDWKSIYCLSPNISIWYLRTNDVCQSEEPEPLDYHWYYIIGLEVLLIIIVIVKVWYDGREFRRSGSLPLCSDLIPRLPCDFMLEGLKDKS